MFEGIKFPIYEKKDQFEESTLEKINIAIEIAITKSRLPKSDLKEVVKRLCENKYLTLSLIAELLNKNEDYIRKDVLNPMVAQQELFRAFPQTPNDPRQAYTSTKE